jgi:hypothetical protein
VQNHKWALHPDSCPGRNPWHQDESRKSNPFAEDMREARQRSERFMLSPSGKAVLGDIITFGLDMISEGQQMFWVRSGDPSAITSEMIPVADDLMSFSINRSKYVIISPGGPPASQALYGTQNCFDLAMKGAISKGGEALVVAPLDGRPDLPKDVSGLAPDRRSKELFWDNLVKLLPLSIEESRKSIADNFELYLWKTDRVLRLFKEEQLKIYLHSQLPEDVVKPGGFEVAQDIQGWIDERVRRNDGLFTVINQGNKLCVWGRS